MSIGVAPALCSTKTAVSCLLLCLALGCAAGGDGAETPVAPPMAGAAGTAAAASVAKRVIHAGPADYAAKLKQLRPGDTLLLEPGAYDPPHGPPGLSIDGLHGRPDAPIVVSGPETGPRPVFLGGPRHNTVRLRHASHVVVRNLEIDGRDLGGDGVKAEGPTHHITLENLVIRGVGPDQSVVGISTVGGPAGNWVIRGNTITRAGTGMYLGHSDGTNPFVAGLIERNLIRDTIGYNMQIKHQTAWASVEGLPTGRSVTVIRHNVFSKGSNSGVGPAARPNVLVGDVAPSGPGSDNGYVVYGNFFFRNPTEALFQGEGNVALYANLLFNDQGPAVHIQRHNGRVRRIDVFGNTVVASSTGILVQGGEPGFEQRAMLNAVFAAPAIVGLASEGNIAEEPARAASYLNDPVSWPGLDLRPKESRPRAPSTVPQGVSDHVDWNLDFDGHPRRWLGHGAYDAAAGAPRWRPRLEIKR